MSDTTNRDAPFVPAIFSGKRSTYEKKLAENLEWAMEEGSRHFENRSAVHETLRRICKRLTDLEISYAVVGGMALFRYGYRRFTEDVDILVTRESLVKIHEALDGLGYQPPFHGSKHLRDTEYLVKIEFLVTGEFPGDGKPKDVAFPDPADVFDEDNGIRYLNLNSLIELKIASGLTGKDRMKDLVDVQELIRTLALPKSLSGELSPYVSARFVELWDAANSEVRQYMKLWPDNLQATDRSPAEVELLKQMQADGVSIEADRSTVDGYIRLVTTDPDIARKYDMHDEREFFGKDTGRSM